MSKLSIGLGIMLVLLMVAVPSFAIKFTVEPASATVSEGKTVALSIYLDDWAGPNNVAAVDYYFASHPTAATIVSVTKAAAWDDSYSYIDVPVPGIVKSGVVHFGAGVAGPKMLLQTVVLQCNDGDVDIDFMVGLGADGIVLDAFGTEYRYVNDAHCPIYQTNFCNGNFDYDKDVDGSDASTFKASFGRSALKNPCPSDGPAPVGRTGQMEQFYTGDDGDLQKGVPSPNPRFTDNRNGTVTDNSTGLIWLKDAGCIGEVTRWNDAVGLVYSTFYSGQCGLTDGSQQYDWRLPHRYELESLIDLNHYGPALPSGHPFVDVRQTYYWSSTTVAGDNDLAWIVSMEDGSVGRRSKESSLAGAFVWSVRGGH